MSRSLFESIEKTQIDHIVDSSSKFAEMLSSSITASAPSVCVQKKQNKKSFILNTADLPSILIEFTAVRNREKSAYLNNDELKRLIVEELATTVDDYLRSTMQANSN
jgi:N-acetylmuramoyl-L-alanine amidase